MTITESTVLQQNYRTLNQTDKHRTFMELEHTDVCTRKVNICEVLSIERYAKYKLYYS